MTPARFRLKVADHMAYHSLKDEAAGIYGAAFALGWLDVRGMATDTAPRWLAQYRDLVAWRESNLRQARDAENRAAECQRKLEELTDAHA
jgi:hypothetical protein